MIKFFTIIFYFLFITISAREIGQTEITTEEGIEVYQKEKFYLLKKNVIIDSDNFNLKAQIVKAFFNEDLYDIEKINSEGNVTLTSSTGLRASGNKIDFEVKTENIVIVGINSKLITNDFNMQSNELIDVNNFSKNFTIIGEKSKITTSEIFITGNKITGSFLNENGENIIEKMHVEDKKEINIKTETLNMFAISADFIREENIIELFNNVKIIRGAEVITGDYAKINTFDESYKITSGESKKVKVLLNNTNE